MPNSWDLKALREFVKINKESVQLHLERIDSVSRAIEIFEYHKQLAKDSVDKVEPKNTLNAIELVLTPREKSAYYRTQKLVIQANTQACIHYARSIHDLFAQLTNGLLLKKPLGVHDCDIKKLREKLEASQLKNLIDTLLESQDFAYVEAFVNTMKHRNLIQFGAFISFETGLSGVRFKEFKYSGKTFKPLWAEQVLQHALAVKNKVIDIGCVLNQELGVGNV